MSENLPITMKDIARALGISIATVSRALNDSPRISSLQRKRIQEYAKEHNFYPNVIGEALRHNRIQPLKVIGVIVPEFVHYYFASVLSGIEEKARSCGYRVMVAQSNENDMIRKSLSATTSLKTRCVASLCRKPRTPSSTIISAGLWTMEFLSCFTTVYVRA